MILEVTEGDVVSENRIIINRSGIVAYYTLPLHCRRVVLFRYKGGRGQLNLGGFTKTTVAVNGPLSILEPLLEACL